MAVYSKEPIPVEVIQTMLTDQWDTKSGDEIPEPTLVVPNDGTPAGAVRVDTSEHDCIIIALGIPGESETYRDAWAYIDRSNLVELRIVTSHSRQRLYDLKQETRRVIHAQVHSLTNYQVIRYKDFNEMVNEQQNMWEGRITLTLENNRISMET